ncbi:MAG TPA: hypothetical protein VHL58_12465 [Thermoanaerobaculia bacterium]|nr:hypothetical protein [Thermoanaerobaculia bacterium]
MTLAYFLTRVSGLSRELVSEEGKYLMPGRIFFLGQGFDLYHKPPLTSLLLGAFSFIGHDPVVGGRLVPFLVGLFVCLLPLLLTDSVVPSILVLLSPFFLGASAHMQTDPTVGLLGYGLASAGIFLWYQSEGARGGAALVAGLFVLWLGKLEIAVIASTVLFLVTLALSPPQRPRLIRLSIITTALGIVSFVLITWILGMTVGLGFPQSVGMVVRTVTRISGGLVHEGMADAGSNIARRLMLLSLLGAFQVNALFILALVPILVSILLLGDERRSFLPLFGALFVAAFLPIFVYFAGCYLGDGFPRYFLIVFPPLLILLGFSLQHLSPQRRRYLGAGTVILAMAFLLPDVMAVWKSPWSVNVGRGTGGYRQATDLVSFLTRPGDLILAPEMAMYSIPDRRWLVHEEFLPYPEKHQAALARAADLRAAIVPRLPGGPKRYQSLLGQLVKAIDEKGSKSFYYGPLEIVVVCPANCRVPLPGPAARTTAAAGPH